LSYPLTLGYTVADIGGAKSIAWLGTASTVATAAIAPFGGAISDLIGRRYVGLVGSAFLCIGLIVIGTAKRMPVAIGGFALQGVGGAFAELVGFSGITELAPVVGRGKYMGLALIFSLPFCAGQAYGISVHNLFRV
jgi:MFS family permease